MCAIGMDGMAFLEAQPFEAILMDEVFQEACKTRKIMDDNLAATIVNGVGKVFGAK